MPESKSDVLQGTLDLMVLKTLESMGSLHGYGIARRIEQVSANTLSVNQGTIYPALLRLEQRAWVKAEAAMRFTLSSPQVKTVIPGMKTEAEVDMNVAYSDGQQFPSELLEKVATHNWPRNYYK